MIDRPHSRRTVLVWWATVAIMLVIAVVFLLVTSPWNDPTPKHPTPHHKSTQQRS